MRLTIPDDELTEKQFEQQLIGTRGNPGLARTLGWQAYHTLKSKGSEPGYPDWTLARERVVFLELKTEAGKVSEAQKAWGRWLHAAGAEFYIARPSDMGLLTVILRIRALDSLNVPWERTVAASKLYEKTRELIES